MDADSKSPGDTILNEPLTLTLPLPQQPSPQSQTSSPQLDSPQQYLPLQLDPDSDMFATHLREFVEYQKVRNSPTLK